VKTIGVDRLKLPDSLQVLRPLHLENLVRLGKPADGGYVVPNHVLLSAKSLLSFGVGRDWSFERDLLAVNPNLTIHAYDHTVNERMFLASIFVGLSKFATRKMSIRDVAGRLMDYAAYRKIFFSSKGIHFRERVYNRNDRPTDTTVKQAFSRLGKETPVFVKIDIEGGEYRIIEDLLQFENLIPLLLIEFHDTCPFRELFLKKIDEILQSFEIAHIHGNNNDGMAEDRLPETLEITFLNKKYLPSERRALRAIFPIIGLDYPNNPSKPDYRLIFDYP